jgi:hypothetical protein
MKSLVEFDKEIGADGLKAKGAIGVDGENLSAAISVIYPIAKIIEPATKALDVALDKLETLIPGDWDKAIIEKVKAEYKAELVKLLAE